MNSQLQCIYLKYWYNILQVAQCAFTLMLMAVFWMTEALPLSVTALLPALLFPLFGIMKSTQVSKKKLIHVTFFATCESCH